MAGARSMADWLAARLDGLRLSLKVTPRAAKSEVKGIETDAAGDAHLAVRVSAPPDGGRANGELLRLLARRWGIAARDLKLVQGQTGRRKVLHLDGPSPALAARLRDLEEKEPG